MAVSTLTRSQLSPSRLALALACAIALVLTGCGGADDGAGDGGAAQEQGDGDDSDDQGDPDDQGEEDFSAPEAEDEDAREEGEAPGGGGVSIEVAGLPIGGNAEADPGDPTVRCASVSWTGPPDLPDEVVLELTDFGLDPIGAYEVGEDGCTGILPPCLSNPGALNAGGQCGVTVRQVAASPDGTGALSLQQGAVACAEQAVCDQFVADLSENTNPARVEWSDALTVWDDDSEDNSSEEDTEGDGSDGGDGSTEETDTSDEVDSTG